MMGRPHTLTGTIMAGHVIELELQIVQLKRLLNAIVKSRSIEPFDYLEAIGAAQDMADDIQLATNNIGGIVRANGELPALCADATAVMQQLANRVDRLLEPPHHD